MVTERHPRLPSGLCHALARVTSPQADPLRRAPARKPSSSSKEHGSAALQGPARDFPSSEQNVACPAQTHTPPLPKTPPLRSLPGTTEYPQQKRQGWSVTRGLENQKMQVSLVSPEGRPQQCLREHWARSKSPFCPRMLPFLQGGASPHAGLSLASLAGSSRMTGSPGSADGQRPARGLGGGGRVAAGSASPGVPEGGAVASRPPGFLGSRSLPGSAGRPASLWAVNTAVPGGPSVRRGGGGSSPAPCPPLASRPPSCVGSG